MSKQLNGVGWRIPSALSVMVFCYAPVVMALASEWTTNPLFSYGVAVPFISAYMIWVRGADLREGRTAPPDYRLGIPLVLLAAGLLIVGHAASVSVLKGLSLIISVGALLSLFAGRGSLRAMWFPVAYLVLMLPVWDFALHRLHLPSQELSARIAAQLLPLVGVPSLLQGTTIQIPSRTLDVMRECSGVSQLIALMAMVLPAAYLWLGTFIRRAGLVAAAIAIGYLSNGVRITLIGWLAANKMSDGNPEGLMHTVQGLVVAGLGYLAIGACLSVLAARQKTPTAAPRDPRLGLPVTAVRHWGLDAILAAVMVAAGATQLAGSTPETQLRAGLAGVPDSVDGWTSVTRNQATAADLMIDPQLLASEMAQSRFTGVDEAVVKEYRHASGAHVQLYVGYYRNQEQGKELAGPLAHALHAVSSDLRIGADRAIEIREVQRRESGRGVLYWYQVGGRQVSNIYHAKRLLIWDALVHRRSDAAAVLVVWKDGSGVPAAARAEAVAFAQMILPRVRERLPK